MTVKEILEKIDAMEKKAWRSCLQAEVEGDHSPFNEDFREYTPRKDDEDLPW